MDQSHTFPLSQTLIDSTIESKGESPHREFIAHFLYADFSQRSYNGREWTYTPPSQHLREAWESEIFPLQKVA